MLAGQRKFVAPPRVGWRNAYCLRERLFRSLVIASGGSFIPLARKRLPGSLGVSAVRAGSTPALRVIWHDTFLRLLSQRTTRSTSSDCVKN